MTTFIFISTALVFITAYFKYAEFLKKRIFELNDQNPCPSQTMRDNVDYVPTPVIVLFGHHFSSIAGAGPVLGPIIAGLAFGWLPVWLWIIFGSIFIGGVHDFATLIISVRNRGRSIAEIVNKYMSKRAYRLMLGFIWLSLVYVLTVFTDLTASSFKNDPGVATSSALFIILAIGFGLALYRLKLPLVSTTLFFVLLLFLSIWLGQILPLNIPAIIYTDPVKTWSIILILYCLAASVTPVWILLQPRDYLSSFLLYTSLIGGLLGILLGGIPIEYPAFVSWKSPQAETLFPFLFITVACGAVSGFHSLVASGTSSKQVKKESHTKPIGYGAMLIEGMVAIISLITVMIIDNKGAMSQKAPLTIYGAGMAKFLSVFGIPERYGYSFGILALSTFILTTLDTATRLARYALQELFDLTGRFGKYLATIFTLSIPTLFVLMTIKDPQGNPIPAWKVIWPIFGTTNQLLAGLALLVVAVWLKKKNKPIWFVILPMIFMLTVTLWALSIIILKHKLEIIGIIGILLFFLASFMSIEAIRLLKTKRPLDNHAISNSKSTNNGS